VFHVVVASVGWIAVCLLVPMMWISAQLQRQMAASADTGGVADAAIQVSGWILIAPLVLFWVAWVVARRVKH